MAQPPPPGQPIVRVNTDGVRLPSGWRISTRKGPIISDRDSDNFRQAAGEAKSLPEMLFSSSRVTLVHEGTAMALDFTALGALNSWRQEDLPPLQVRVAQEWQAARQAEIVAQGAIKLEYDWTFTTPYTGDLVLASACNQPMGPGDHGVYRSALPPPASTTASTTAGHAANGLIPPQQTGSSHVEAAGESGTVGSDRPLSQWEETEEQMDRALLMERDPILFFDEVPLFESDLDDNGVSQLTVKIRVMPRAWLVLLRFWLRVDGCMVRLRETRLFCRHDTPELARCILREQRYFEGTFAELRAAGAPGEGPAYTDGDTAAQTLQAVSPVGLKLLQLHKLVL